MVCSLGDAAAVHQVIDLACARCPPDEVGKPQGGGDVQVLVNGAAVANLRALSNQRSPKWRDMGSRNVINS
jgi:hypothetical protein